MRSLFLYLKKLNFTNFKIQKVFLFMNVLVSSFITTVSGFSILKSIFEPSKNDATLQILQKVLGEKDPYVLISVLAILKFLAGVELLIAGAITLGVFFYDLLSE